MNGHGSDPLDAGSRELHTFRGYGRARRFALRITVGLVPGDWPPAARAVLLVPAHIVAFVLTLALWIPVTLALGISLLSRSPSGR